MQVEKHQPKSIVHPWLEICDIAGLVKGAAQVMCVMYVMYVMYVMCAMYVMCVMYVLHVCASCGCVFAYIHACIHTHTHTHTCIRTCMPVVQKMCYMAVVKRDVLYYTTFAVVKKDVGDCCRK